MQSVAEAVLFIAGALVAGGDKGRGRDAAVKRKKGQFASFETERNGGY